MLIHSAAPVRLEVNMRWGQIEVDNTPTREDMGLKSTLPYIHSKAREERAEFLEIIGDIAWRGDQLGRIEGNYTPGEDARHVTRPRIKEVNIGYRRPPQVQGNPGNLEMEVVPRGSRLNVLI